MQMQLKAGVLALGLSRDKVYTKTKYGERSTYRKELRMDFQGVEIFYKGTKIWSDLEMKLYRSFPVYEKAFPILEMAYGLLKKFTNRAGIFLPLIYELLKNLPHQCMQLNFFKSPYWMYVGNKNNYTLHAFLFLSSAPTTIACTCLK